ncbi:MAG TPA: extracellular solute-binding protein [Candidatus Limnocylindria bacterium]|nr:extracellular solute-binding protein [Candidatus Limnocylindria bacterium]
MTRIQSRFVPVAAGLLIVLGACTAASPSASPPASESESVAPSVATYPTGDIAIELWTKEGDPQIDFVQQLADDYNALHPNVTITVVNKGVETLREDLVNTALSPDAQPELVWTVADHVGPFTTAGVIQPLDAFVDAGSYDPVAYSATVADGQQWGVPISNGNQLMLYWNKSIIGDDPPADTDELISVAQANTDEAAGTYGFVFNETESFWLTPWIGGFGGKVFADDGVTPTLNTDAMKGALQFLYDLKWTDGLMPNPTDYTVASDLFTTGSAAMIVNGDWELGNYADKLGDDLGVGPLPLVVGHEDPHPYTAGAFFMVPSGVEGDALIVVADFMKWATDTEQQLAMVDALRRLPANAAALADPIVTGDPLLAGAAAAVQKGTPQPTNVEMRCVFDNMNTAIRDVLGAGNSDIDTVVETMQTSTENCIATQA